MPKKKRKGGNDKRRHAAQHGSARPLCGARSTKVTRDPLAVDCEGCGRTAVALDQRARQGLSEALNASPVPMGAGR